jgi:periplasmic protein TonB
MGYQALLFCPDEKLARVVSQVFTELDFSIEPVNEPFAAVKKLMAQRYDAIVVDCDNEQNTSLLFKSARNSTSNQGSLAIALVEGQAGVAKAYRIGANLVLTKPINLEQTKGTLRVARGLLRKGAEGTTGSPSAGTAKPAKAPSVAIPRQVPPPQPVAPVAAATPPMTPNVVEPLEEVMTPLPALAASANPEQEPVIAPAPVAQTTTPVVEEQPTKIFAAMPPAGTDRRKEERVRPVVAAPASVAPLSSQAAAAAPAPAKEVVPQVKEVVKEEEEERKPVLPTMAPLPMEEHASASSSISDGPTFAALGVEDTSASGGGKKILIGVVALVALIAIAYFGWTQFGQSHPGTPQQSAPAAQPAPQDNPPPQLAPMSSPAPAPTTTVERASTSTTDHAPKSPPAQTSKPSVSDAPQQITLNSEPAANKTSEAPLRVKAAAVSTRPQPQAEEAAAQPPSPLGVNSSEGANLSGLISAPNVARPTLARVKLSQGISQGLLIKRVAPKYPPAALQMHLEGAVQIEATIDKEGLVTNPKVVKGDHILAAAALDAVRQWRYKPYYLDGEPVEVETEITINFKGN